MNLRRSIDYSPQEILDLLQQTTVKGCFNEHEALTGKESVRAIGVCTERDGGANCACPHSSNTAKGYTFINRFRLMSMAFAPDPDYRINSTQVMQISQDLLEQEGLIEAGFESRIQQYILIRWMADRLKAYVARKGIDLSKMDRVENLEIQRKLQNYVEAFQSLSFKNRIRIVLSRSYRAERKLQKTKSEEEFREVKGWIVLEAQAIRQKLIDGVSQIVGSDLVTEGS